MYNVWKLHFYNKSYVKQQQKDKPTNRQRYRQTELEKKTTKICTKQVRKNMQNCKIKLYNGGRARNAKGKRPNAR